MPNISLTAREREIVHLLCRGYGHKEIAAQLNIKAGTLRNTMLKIGQRYRVPSTAVAIVIAALADGVEDASDCYLEIRGVVNHG